MGNISIKINLRQFKHIVKKMKKQDGSETDCLIIPIKENMFHEGEKGIYVDMTAIEIKNKVGDSKDTHLIKQNIPKEIYEAMSEEQRRAFPILGNAINWSRQEAEPVPADIQPDIQQGEEDHDDLPF